jgi:Flp pilus assembly protein TadG
MIRLMNKIIPLKVKKLGSRQEGAVSVEFALILLVLLTIVFGIIDFGHAWFMRQVITTASREGARLATRFQTNTEGTKITPDTLSKSIQDWVKDQYANLLPTDANLAVVVDGDGYTTGATGTDVRVTVNATKNWFMIHNFVPGMTSGQLLSATTTMKCE